MKLSPSIRGLAALSIGFGALALAIVVSAQEPAPPGQSTPPAPPKAAKPQVADFRVDKPSSAVAKIQAALEKSAKADFVMMSLREVVEYLSDSHGIRILFDTRLVPEETQLAAVTLNLTDVPLSAVLDRVLDSQKLDWVIRDNVLLVTTPRRAANLLETHYYDLNKLGRVEGTPADIVDLIGQLQEDSVPDDLNAQEQIPEATKKVVNQNNLLIVRDNRHGHEMIEKLLLALAASAPDEPTTTVVPIPKLPALLPGVTTPRTPPVLPPNPAPKPEALPPTEPPAEKP